MFQTFISRHNSNFFSDKLVLTSVNPASSAPVLQTPKATSSTLYFDSLTVNAGNGGFLHCIQMDTSVNAANQVVSVGADIAFDADPKFDGFLVRFESSTVPTIPPTTYYVYPFDCFFFSSRRRHTRCSRDWSSDVCSSDLETEPAGQALGVGLGLFHQAERRDRAVARQGEELRGAGLVQPARHHHAVGRWIAAQRLARDRKSTRLNSSHGYISYAVFCLKKKS